MLAFMVRTLLSPVDWLVDSRQAKSLGVNNRLGQNPYLRGNWGPVDEELPLQNNLFVQGSIPPEAAGEFVRNGPNPAHVPRGGYHWFDGDGMLHGVRLFRDGTASYVNRYVRTYRYLEEKKAGGVLYPRIGEWIGKWGLLKLLLYRLKLFFGGLSESQGIGTANTALTFHNSQLLALVEADLPYAIRMLMDGELETIGRVDFGGELKHPVTAHPKVCPETGEMVFFCYRLLDESGPQCFYSVLNSKGELVVDFPVYLLPFNGEKAKAVMMHDFAVTRNHSILMDMPLEFTPKEIVKGVSAFTFNPDRPCRFGVLPRLAKSAEETVWFEFNSCYIFHTIAAWEETNEKDELEVVLLGCRSNSVNLSSLQSAERGEKVDYPVPHEYRMNLVTKQCTEKALIQQPDLIDEEDQDCRLKAQICSEFPTIHPGRVGCRVQYAYLATFLHRDGQPYFDGCIKIDLNEGGRLVGRIPFGENRYGGECVFVPKDGATEEDDGYLMTFVFDEAENMSQFWILDAKSMAEEPIAVISLPQRVPYGFHGLFVPEKDMERQSTA